MTGFVAAPKNKCFQKNWDKNERHDFFNFYIEGLYWQKSTTDMDIYCIGSPYLDYSKEETVENILSSALNKVLAGQYHALELHGFSTLVVIKKEEFIVVSDCDGYRTFYLSNDGSGPIVSSKIDFINEIDGLHTRLNVDDFDFSLIFGYFPLNKTVAANVVKAEAATAYRFGIKGQMNCQKVTIDNSPAPAVSLEESIDQLYTHISNSLSSLKQIDSKLGVLLGGFDSALMVAMAVKAGFEVETFSFYYEDEKYNQGKVDVLLSLYNVKHHWIPVTVNVVEAGLKAYNKLYSTPSNWPHYIIQSDYLASKVRERGFKIVLTGDGCDGLFQGYPQLYRSAKVFNENKFVSIVSRLAKIVLHNEISERKLGHVYRLLMRVYRNSYMKNPEKTYLMYRICDEASIARLRGASEKNIMLKVQKNIAEVSGELKNISYTRLAYLGRSNMGPNRTKINGIVDNNNLYLFSPYMHWKVKGFVSSMPENFLRPEGESSLNDIGKYVLVKMAEKYNLLTEDIIHQPKMAAVDAPVDDWYENQLNFYVKERIINSNVIVNKNFALDLAKPKVAEKIYRKYISADAVTSHFLSILLTTICYEYDRHSSNLQHAEAD